ncbi:MAG: L-histidine N(alpha)-methyltransferase, partial [Rhodospirillaceae bacterium]|nr:L-histidine N(alpha)-methyltransferase [Rhodospirillaceae bacterium]
MDQTSTAKRTRRDAKFDIRQLDTGVQEPDGADVVRGLGAAQKTLPPKYFYDARGSRLFEQITVLPEYYLTRTEQRILHDHARRIAEAMGPADLIELGSGSSRKTRLIIEAFLDRLPRDESLRYVPIDVSEAAVEEAATALSASYPRLGVSGLVATYEAALAD